MLTGRHVGVIGQFELGSPMAHAINTCKTAGGFARLGANVSVCILPSTSGASEQSAATALGEHDIHWIVAPRDMRTDTPMGADAYGRWAAGELKHRAVDIVYARSFSGGLAAADLGLPTIIETHAHPGDPNPFIDRVCAATRGPLRALVTIADVLREHLVSRGALASSVHVVPDGVDVNLFARPVTLPARPRLLGAADRPIALYAGHLYEVQGIPTMIQAAMRAPDIDWVMLGGLPKDIERVRAAAAAQDLSNVRVLGRVDHVDVPAFLWHADVLLLPPAADHPTARWMSPVKLGEYLAARRPIVASSVPALRSWVDDTVVRWFTPGDPDQLVLRVREALSESNAQRAIRERAAAEKAEQYSYANRARSISRAAA